MRRLAAVTLAAALVAAGCAGGNSASPEAEVLGEVLTEPSATPETLTVPSDSPETLTVQDATVDGTLNWGATEGGCVAILDPESLDRDAYRLSVGVRPFVEDDCPNWEPSYDLRCQALLQSAADHATSMRGTLSLELVVDGAVRHAWTIEVDELAEPGQKLTIGPGEGVAVSSEGRPDVTCHADFEAA